MAKSRLFSLCIVFIFIVTIILFPTSIQEVLATEGPGPDDPATIDVMVVYTPAARDWAINNAGGIDNCIMSAINAANDVLEKSKTGVTLNLAYSAMVDYTTTGNLHWDLRRLRDTDGEIDEVHEWRDEYGADLVSMFVGAEVDEDLAGSANQLESYNGSPEDAFSVCQVNEVHNRDTTFIHELGHNMGCGHSDEQIYCSEGPTVWDDWEENTWSAGYRWTDSDSNHWCTVMTYRDGDCFENNITNRRLHYFSNPNATYNDDATGDEGHNNALTIREMKHKVAAYRQRVTGYVRSDLGTPLVEAQVTVDGTERTVSTDHNGRYEIYLTLNMTYDLTASYQTFGDETCTVQVGVEPSQQDFSLDGDYTGGVKGVVGDRVTGCPLELAVVRVTELEPELVFLTNNSGHYEIRLDQGTYKLTASHEQFYDKTHTVNVGTELVVWNAQLVPIGTCGVQGLIGNAATGLPIYMALVKAYRFVDGVYIWEGYYDYTDQDGYYKIYCPPGKYKFRVSRSGFVTRWYCCKWVYDIGFPTLNLLLTPEGGWYPD